MSKLSDTTYGDIYAMKAIATLVVAAVVSILWGWFDFKEHGLTWTTLWCSIAFIVFALMFVDAIRDEMSGAEQAEQRKARGTKEKQ